MPDAPPIPTPPPPASEPGFDNLPDAVLITIRNKLVATLVEIESVIAKRVSSN